MDGWMVGRKGKVGEISVAWTLCMFGWYGKQCSLPGTQRCGRQEMELMALLSRLGKSKPLYIPVEKGKVNATERIFG